MLFKRKMQTVLSELAINYPVVTVTGPRQAGKTTLAKACFPNVDCVNLEAPFLGIGTETQMASHPLRGALFENMVVMDLVKTRFNRGLDPRLSFYRDSQGVEIDVLFEEGARIMPIEIKSSETFHPRFLKSIEQVGRVIANFDPGYIIYAGDYEQGFDGNRLINFKNIGQVMSY